MHLHCAQAGVNNPEPVVILCNGKYPIGDVGVDFVCGDDDVMGTSIIPQTCNGVEIKNLASLYQAMRDGSIYWNAHTDAFPEGEIRGQIFTL